MLSKYYGVEELSTTSGIMVILVIQARDDEGRKGRKGWRTLTSFRTERIDTFGRGREENQTK